MLILYIGRVSNSIKNGMCVYCVYNVEYMGRVSNSNNTWNVLICVVYNKLEKVFKLPGVRSITQPATNETKRYGGEGKTAQNRNKNTILCWPAKTHVYLTS